MKRVVAGGEYSEQEQDPIWLRGKGEWVVIFNVLITYSLVSSLFLLDANVVRTIHVSGGRTI